MSSLGEQIKKEIEGFYSEVNEITKEVARTVMQTVVENTVIDTSQAVSNWQLQLDTPNTDFINAHFLGAKGSTARQSEQETLRQAENEIDKRVLHQPIFITNNIEGSEEYDQNSQVLIAESVAVESIEQSIALAQVKFRNK